MLTEFYVVILYSDMKMISYWNIWKKVTGKKARKQDMRDFQETGELLRWPGSCLAGLSPKWPWLALKDLWFFWSEAYYLEMKPYIIFSNLFCSKLLQGKKKDKTRTINLISSKTLGLLSLSLFYFLVFLLLFYTLLSFNVPLNKCNTCLIFIFLLVI